MSRRKCLLLVVHNTAQSSYSQLLKHLDCGCYIPNYSNEGEIITSELCKLNSTISDKALDSFYFFKENMSANEARLIALKVISLEYDFVISNFYPPTNLNIALIQSGIKIFFTVWGGISFDPLSEYMGRLHDQIMNSENSQYLICHKHINPKLGEEVKRKSMPGRIPIHDMSEHQGIWSIDDSILPIILIVSSRLNEPVQHENLNLIRYILNSFPDIHFTIAGKSNDKAQLPNNAELLTFETQRHLYERMRISKLLVSLSPIFNGVSTGMILKYSSIEASIIGLPTLFFQCNNSPELNYSIGPCAASMDGLIDMIKLDLNKPKITLREQYSHQRSLYDEYKIENCAKDYEKILSNL